jgi:hypothetical protein
MDNDAALAILEQVYSSQSPADYVKALYQTFDMDPEDVIEHLLDGLPSEQLAAAIRAGGLTPSRILEEEDE